MLCASSLGCRQLSKGENVRLITCSVMSALPTVQDMQCARYPLGGSLHLSSGHLVEPLHGYSIGYYVVPQGETHVLLWF